MCPNLALLPPPPPRLRIGLRGRPFHPPCHPVALRRRDPARKAGAASAATGIGTPVSAVRGRRPSPLDDGGSGGHSSGGLRLPRFIRRLGGAVASWVRGRSESAQSADACGRLRGGVLCAAG